MRPTITVVALAAIGMTIATQSAMASRASSRFSVSVTVVSPHGGRRYISSNTQRPEIRRCSQCRRKHQSPH